MYVTRRSAGMGGLVVHAYVGLLCCCRSSFGLVVLLISGLAPVDVYEIAQQQLNRYSIGGREWAPL